MPPVPPQEITCHRTHEKKHRKGDNPGHADFPEEDVERHNLGILDQEDETQDHDYNDNPLFHFMALNYCSVLTLTFINPLNQPRCLKDRSMTFPIHDIINQKAKKCGFLV
jgi:hypothetical protein